MKKLLTPTAALAVVGVVFSAQARPGEAAATVDLAGPILHLALEKSSPEKGEMLSASPEEVTLWFTQAPQMSGTSIRLLPKGGEPLDLGSAAASDADEKIVVLTVDRSLADGEYEIMWRAMAQDGHTIRGEIPFMVHAAR